MMASATTVLIAALGAVLVFSLIGAGLNRWLKPGWAAGGGIEASLGWGAFTAVALPLQTLTGLTQASTVVLALVAVAGAIFAMLFLPRSVRQIAPLPAWAHMLAAAIALIPLVALLPRHVDTGVIVSWTASDHAKVAMIDEMTRLGLPAGNPFFGAHGARGLLTYYYLWHFGAAQLSILAGISGWEADAAMTGFTAYASLILMMSMASRLCILLDNGDAKPLERADAGPQKLAQKPIRTGAQKAAISWVALFSLAGSLRPVLGWVLGWDRLGHLLSDYRDLETWLAQASWVPQHLAAASCVVLAALILIDLAQKPRVSAAVLLGAMAAAGFGSSAWVGGVAFVAIAASIVAVMLIRGGGRARIRFIVGVAVAAVAAIVLAAPLLMAEFATLGARHGGAPIALHPFEVIGALKPRLLRRMLDLPAFWLILLPIDFPAIYPAGAVALALYLRHALKRRSIDPLMLGMGVLVLLSLTVSWLFISTIGNNDLGWRAMLPAVLVLTALAAAALAHWVRIGAYPAAATALVLVALSLPERTAVGDITGKASDDAADFADGPALWKAVRQYAGPNARIANNPLYLNDLAGYPVNISWALLSDRPSCYSGWETARAYIDLPNRRLKALDDQFIRVFAGKAKPGDLRQMAEDYGCRVAVVTDSDGAWKTDPFAASSYYRLAQGTDEWRIYVASSARSAPGEP
jgi:hypothetical protein